MWQKTLTAAVNVIIINDCTFQWLRQINSSAPGQSFLIWPDAVDAAGICPFLSTLTWFVEVTSKQMLQRNIVKTLCHNKVGNIIGYYWKMDAQHLRIYILFSTGLSVYKSSFFWASLARTKSSFMFFSSFSLHAAGSVHRGKRKRKGNSHRSTLKLVSKRRPFNTPLLWAAKKQEIKTF